MGTIWWSQMNPAVGDYDTSGGQGKKGIHPEDLLRRVQTLRVCFNSDSVPSLIASQAAGVGKSQDL